jgi:hypothetical protein
MESQSCEHHFPTWKLGEPNNFQGIYPPTWIYKILEVLTQSMATLGFQRTSPNELFNLTNPIETQPPSKSLHHMQVLI